MGLGVGMGVLGIQKLIKETTHNRMQRDVSLGKQGRSQKKVGGKNQRSLPLQSLPNPQANNNKKGTAGVGAGTPSALPASDVEWCVLFFFF